jgi:hypothetical protein
MSKVPSINCEFKDFFSHTIPKNFTFYSSSDLLYIDKDRNLYVKYGHVIQNIANRNTVIIRKDSLNNLHVITEHNIQFSLNKREMSDGCFVTTIRFVPGWMLPLVFKKCRREDYTNKIAEIVMES